MDALAISFDGDMPEVSSYEDYEHLKAKQRASILWLLSKAYNNDIPTDLRDPFYKDHDEQDRLKPQITHSLANVELYCLALANIYSDPNYHCLNHHGIMQILTRKGVYIVEPNDASLTETVLVQTAPIKMSAHMVMIEGIMTLYIKEVLIPEKVAEVVSRFVSLDLPDEMPEDPEEAALFWINKSCVKLKQIMQRDMNEDKSTRNDPTPYLPMLEDLTDMSDGCCLAALLSFYCPDHLRWQEICLNKEMSMADSIYNLQLVQFFCQEKLPYNICFLSLEDFLYLHDTIQPNVLAFIADLLFLFEIRTAKCVQQPGIDLSDETLKDESIHNGSSLCYPELPTPAEMKAKSLQHSAWIDETQDRRIDQRNGGPPIRPPRKSSLGNKSRQTPRHSTHGQSDEDEELTRYFSALDIKIDVDSSPEIIMINDRNDRKTPLRTGPKSITSYSIKDNHLEQNDSYLSSLPIKNHDTTSNNNGFYLTDYFTQLAANNNSSPSKKSPNTTSFAKLNSENTKNLSMPVNNEPVINIAYMQKNDKSTADQRSPQKSVSSRSIPHFNNSDTFREIFEQNIETNATVIPVKTNPSDTEIASQVYNIRMSLEEKRKKIEMERKLAEEQWFSQRQNIGKEAFLRVVHKNGKDDNTSENNIICDNNVNYEDYSRQQLSSSPTNKPFIGRTFRVTKSKVLSPDYSVQDSPTHKNSIISENFNDSMNNGKAESPSSSSTEFSTKENSNFGDVGYPVESFFISFGNDKIKSKPVLKPKQIKQQQQMKREQKLAAASLANNSESNETYSQTNSSFASQSSPKPNAAPSPIPVTPGVGFIIGADLVNLDPTSESEMAKRKESIMMSSLKRRAEQEAKRIKKEQDLAHKRNQEWLRREDSEKRREEKRIKREFILEQYRQRKSLEEAEKNGSHKIGNSSTLSSKDSSRSNSTFALNRQPRQRLLSGGKPRPKSLHISASNIQDYSSLDCKPSRIMDDVDASFSNYNNNNNIGSRPQSAMSSENSYSLSNSRRQQWPTAQNHQSSHLSALPPGYMLARHKGLPSDCASDAGSTFSEYTGPKLFVKPSQKSNKVLILNAVNVVLAGAVNSDMKKKVIEEINASDSKHYLILFRNASLQFRAIYSYNPDREEVLKLHGTGPKGVINEMIDRFYKYNSGSKSFTEIQTKHLSVTIDAFTIHNNIWVGKRIIPKKDYL